MRIYISILLLIINFFCYSQSKVDENKEWLDIDKQGFIELNRFIENKKFSFSDFKNEIKKYQINNISDIFYGSFMVSILQTNGYTSFSITIGVSNDKIFYFKFFLDENNASVIKKISTKDYKINELLKRNWKIIKYDKDGKQYSGLEFEFYDDVIINRLYHLVDRVLGKKEINIIKDNNILNAYNKLLYPLNVYPYGNKCGINKVIPDGKKAIKILVNNNRFDLIENILRGYNAEGRAYAMEALINNKKIDDKITPIINKLRKSLLTLNYCQDCFFEKFTYEKLYSKLMYKGTD